MAKADDFYKDLQEEITCSICMELYEDPRVLHCSHTLCFKCIEGVIRARGNFECPFRCNVQVSQQDIEQLPLNRVIHNIVNRMKTNKPAKPNARMYEFSAYCEDQEDKNWKMIRIRLRLVRLIFVEINLLKSAFPYNSFVES